MIILRNGITLETIEQREFGFISKSLGKLRDKTIHKITKSTVDDINARNDILGDHLIKRLKFSDSTRKGVYQEARNNNSRISSMVLNDQPATVSNSNLDIEKIKRSDLLPNRKKKKLIKTVLKNKIGDQILIPKGTKVDVIAHELGHIQIKNSKNPILKNLDKRARKVEPNSAERLEAITINNGPGNHKRYGIKKLIRDIIDEGTIIENERLASKKGLRVLKRAGATKEELKQAKRNYKLALDTYKRRGKANVKVTLRNTLQHPDKKERSIFYD